MASASCAAQDGWTVCPWIQALTIFLGIPVAPMENLKSLRYVTQYDSKSSQGAKQCGSQLIRFQIFVGWQMAARDLSFEYAHDRAVFSAGIHLAETIVESQRKIGERSARGQRAVQLLTIPIGLPVA